MISWFLNSGLVCRWLGKHKAWNYQHDPAYGVYRWMNEGYCYRCGVRLREYSSGGYMTVFSRSDNVAPLNKVVEGSGGGSDEKSER